MLPDVLTVIEKGWSLHRYLQERRAREVPGRDPTGRVAGLCDLLRVLYHDLDVLAGPDGYFPVGVLPLAGRAVGDPDALVGELVPRPGVPPVLEPRVVEAVRGRGPRIWNGNTFSLARLDLAGGQVAAVDAYIGSYFDMVASADYLEYELLAALDRARGPVGLPSLPAREAALAAFESPAACLAAGGGVDAVLAVSTLVVYAREGGWWLLCEDRSGSVAEHGTLYHVVPAFILQPVTSLTGPNLAVEWSVRHNLYREYLEELFGVPEVEHPGGAVAADYFYGHPDLRYLTGLLADGTARLRGTGLGFNLLNHRPEICTLLLIGDEDWYRRQRDELEAVTTMPLDDPAWGRVVRPWLMVPPAAPALVLGARAAVELLGLEEPPWLRPFRLDRARPGPVPIATTEGGAAGR